MECLKCKDPYSPMEFWEHLQSGQCTDDNEEMTLCFDDEISAIGC